MEIALFTDTFLPHPNGVSIAVSRQYNALQSAGYRIELFGPSALDVYNPIRTTRICATADPTYALYLPHEIPSARGGSHHDNVVHVHTPFSFGILGLIYARRKNAVAVYTHHTNFFDSYLHYLGGLNTRLTARLLKQIYIAFVGRFDIVIVPSETARRHLINYLGVRPRSLHQLATPVPSEKEISFRDEVDRDIDILFVSRLAPEKNIHIALEALCAVCTAKPGTTISIVGGGVLANAIPSMICQRLSAHLTLHGVIANSRVLSLMQRSKVLLFPSVTDTQGLVIDEAVVAGMQVVAVSCELTRERLSTVPTASLCEGSSEAIATALLTAVRKKTPEDAPRSLLKH